MVIASLWMFFRPFHNRPMPALIDHVMDDHEATRTQASFIPFLHILGTGSSAMIVGLVSEIEGVDTRWAFALPALATPLAGVLALYASRFVAQDMAPRQTRAASAAARSAR